MAEGDFGVVLIWWPTQKQKSKFWSFCSKHDAVTAAVQGLFCNGYAGCNVPLLVVISRWESAGF